MSPHTSPSLAITATFLMLFCISTTIAGDDQARPFQHYSQIPGVTQEEIQAIEQIRRLRPEGLTCAMVHSDLSFVNVYGETDGFARHLCQELSDLFGIRVTPVLADWNTLLPGLDNRTFDLCGELTATPERLEQYRMTSAVAERELMLAFRDSREKFDLINGREILRYGFLKGSVTYDKVQESSQVSFSATHFEDEREAIEALRKGAIDAFVSKGRLNSAIDTYDDIQYQKYYPLTGVPVSLATSNPDAFAIIAVFQKYLDNGGRERIATIQAEGELEYLRQKLLKELSDAERRYVEDHVRNYEAIPVLAEVDSFPTSFYNRREKRWQGIAHDILAEITRISGLRFNVINPPVAARRSLQDALENGDAAMVTELMQTKSRRGRFLWSQAPYMTDDYALLSSQKTPEVVEREVPYMNVGLIRGTPGEELFHLVFPKHAHVITYDSKRDGFKALAKGRVDLIMTTRSMLLTAAKYRERPGIKTNLTLNQPSDSYFGFNLRQSLLRGVIDKAQKFVDCKNIAERWKKETYISPNNAVQASMPYLLGASTALAAMLALLVTHIRKREDVSRRLSMHDHLTGLPNRRQFDERMGIEWDRAVRERLCISLLAIDIDHFKRINDQYGHPQGDAVLREVARTLGGSSQREGDLAARTGGEEFSVLLPNTAPDGALLLANKIRDAIEKMSVAELAGGSPLKVTVSVGVASVKPGPDDGICKLESRADLALYAAKQGGRNRVHVA